MRRSNVQLIGWSVIVWAGVVVAVILASLLMTGTTGAASGNAATRSCGRVLFDYPATSFRVYMRVRGVTCKRAKQVVASSVFGQGAQPIDGWLCPSTSSIAGRCLKGRARIAYASRRDTIPRL